MSSENTIDPTSTEEFVCTVPVVSVAKTLDELDQIADQVRAGDISACEPLSKFDCLYVALMANRADLLALDGFEIMSAFVALGDDRMAELVERWKQREDRLST